MILNSTLIAIALDFSDVNPIKALYWSAIVNGLLAPFLLVAIFLIIRDETIMHNQTTSRLGQVSVALTTLLMFGAAIGMFVFG